MTAKTPPFLESGVVETYGDIKIGYLTLSGVVVGPVPPRFKKAARRLESILREPNASEQAQGVADNLSKWHALAAEMGLHEREMMPAPTWLYDRIRAGGQIPKINCVVDVANLTALSFGLPVGVFDLNAIDGRVTLRLADEGETFIPLLESTLAELKKNEIVYADQSGVFSRYAKDADRTKITEETTSILCVIDGTPATEADLINRALDFLRQQFLDVLGADRVVESGLI